jgi:hypothetical protein
MLGGFAGPDPRRRVYLGYRPGDYETEFGEFFTPSMAPLPGHVVSALSFGPQAGPTLLAFSDVASLLDEGYHQTENGYGAMGDGGTQVSVRTDMPGVTPPMWAWWFGWHGDDPRRYKLWHPRAHVYAEWSGRGAGYIGRTSFVDEYLGSRFARLAIQFVAPSVLGLDAGPGDSVTVCARVGSSDIPVDSGWLVHHVRATASGCEMRSRFWLGGPHVALRSGNRIGSRVIRPIAALRVDTSAAAARGLMVHCAQEMNHLAGFLAALHSRLA